MEIWIPKDSGAYSREDVEAVWDAWRNDTQKDECRDTGYGWKDQKKNGGLARTRASCERISFRDTLQHPMARWVLGVWGQDLFGWTDRGVVANE